LEQVELEAKYEIEKLNNKKYIKLIGFISLLYLILFLLIKIGVINYYWHSVIKLVLINMILVISLNLITGFLGQFSLAHAGFMAIGAYMSVYMSELFVFKKVFLFVIIISGLSAMFVAYLISALVIKTSGKYLAIISIALNEIIKNIIINFDVNSGVYKNISYKSGFSLIYMILILMLIIIYLLRDSKYGRVLNCINQNEILIKSCGVNIYFYKLIIFLVSAFMAGVAGVLFAHELSIIVPDMFDYDNSLRIMCLVIISGLGNIIGSVIAVMIVSVLVYSFNFSFSLDLRMLIYLILALGVIVFKNNNFITRKLVSFKFKNKNKK